MVEVIKGITYKEHLRNTRIKQFGGVVPEPETISTISSVRPVLVKKKVEEVAPVVEEKPKAKRGRKKKENTK